MALDVSIHTDLSKEALKGATWKPGQQDAAQGGMAAAAQVKASETTGIEWETDGDKFKVRGPDIEDVAVITSTVSAEAPAKPNMIRSVLSLFGVTVSPRDLEECISEYKEAFRSSRSHNLMSERFKKWGEASSKLVKLIGTGVSPKEISSIQAQVRNEALAEIHGRIESDYSNAKATLDIFG